MARTGAGLPARANLAAVRYQAAQQIHVLVVDGLVLLGAELAHAHAAHAAAAAVFAFFFAALVVTAARAPFLFHRSFHVSHLSFRLEGEFVLFQRGLVAGRGGLAAVARRPLAKHDHLIGDQ